MRWLSTEFESTVVADDWGNAELLGRWAAAWDEEEDKDNKDEEEQGLDGS